MTKGAILVTGAAGFIGSNLVDSLLSKKFAVIGIDNFNDYYDPKIKKRNLSEALSNKNFKLFKVNVLDRQKIIDIFKKENIEAVVHLAARAGVRPSIENPILYTRVNVGGTVNLLEISNLFKVKKFIFGSSSSVYGRSTKLPFGENDLCQNIISPYGASKRSAEFFVESFSKCYGLSSVILRFFTVYGKRGRPDMAPAIFTEAILHDKELGRFGSGSTSRDYTFISDIVDGIVEALEIKQDFEIINLGGDSPVLLNDFISTLELVTGKRARIREKNKQTGDVEKTWANIEKAKKLLRWEPKFTLRSGLQKYIQWIQNN